MCCRYLLLQEHLRQILERLGVALSAEFLSRYNIAPGTDLPAVRPSTRKKGAAGNSAASVSTSAAGTSARELVGLRWGLIPSWARDDEGGGLVNARAETLEAKPSFRDALRSRRCLIPASGFYEWKPVGRARQPWLFRRKDEAPFGLAGLWENWRAPDGSLLESCAVITSEPNELMRPIHHRMPVMLRADQFDAWLDPEATSADRLAPLLRPANAAEMTAVALQPRVNHVQYDDPDCLLPASAAEAESPPAPDSQLSLGF